MSFIQRSSPLLKDYQRIYRNFWIKYHAGQGIGSPQAAGPETGYPTQEWELKYLYIPLGCNQNMSLAHAQEKQSHQERKDQGQLHRSLESFTLNMWEISGLMDIVTFLSSHRKPPLPPI